MVRLRMEFGVFDHLDRSALPLRELYEQRLQLCERYDRDGFARYHVAEHHATPLGMASSPNVFLAALAARTERLRFGPLVYALPLYHPIRLIEEICMLDQLSGGRLEIGVGKGISPIETAYFGVDSNERSARFAEVLEIVLQGLRERRVDFVGEYYAFRDVPLELAPIQLPHPPIWAGVATVESAERAGRNGFHFVSLSTAAETHVLAEAHSQGWLAAGNDASGVEAKVGLGRFVILAETDAEALAVARRTYPAWHANFHYLFKKKGIAPALGYRAPEFDQIKDGGRGIAGSPATVTRLLRAQLAEAGANYFVAQFVFGDVTFAEATRTIDLFVAEVMPALRDSAVADAVAARHSG